MPGEGYGCLRSTSGESLGGHRWTGPITGCDERLLARAHGPVLDVGCGPARHALALAQSGVPALGIDISEPALQMARARGVPVLRRSVFERLPGSGRWGTVLLLDGNVGLGGAPARLLARAARLISSNGAVLVELDPPGAPRAQMMVRLEIDGRSGPWFPWAVVGANQVDDLARAAGLEVDEAWRDSGRWFAQLSRGAP